MTWSSLKTLIPLIFLASSGSYGSIYTQSELKNGLDLILVPSSKVPLVTIVLAVKAGAFTETPSTNGLTHLWEHMFFKGNAKLKDQEAFNKRVRELGLVYNGTTSSETVKYYITLPSGRLEEGLEFIADAIQTPRLEKEEIAREIKVVLDEYDRNASQPGFDLSRVVSKVIYGDLAYKTDPLGERDIIKSANREILLKIKSEVFVPLNSALFIAGQYDKEKVKTLVDKYFLTWQNPKDWKPQPPNKFPDFIGEQTLVMYDKKVNNPQASLTFKGPSALENLEDTYTADMLTTLLRQGSGHFYKKFVESGRAFDAGISYPTQKEKSFLTLYLAAKPQGLSSLVDELRKEPDLWSKPGYFSKTQIQDAIRALVIDHKRELNKPSEFVKILSYWWTVTGLDYYENYIEKIKGIGEPQIIAFAKKYFLGKKPLITILLNSEDAKLAKLEENVGPLLEKFKITRESK